MINSDNQLKFECLNKKDLHHVHDKLEDIREENTFYISLYYHIMYYVSEWIRKWVVLRSSYFSEHKRKESIICLYSLSINKNYKSHTFLNLINEVWFQEKWIKTWALIDSECESWDTINMKYVQKQHLQT